MVAALTAQNCSIPGLNLDPRGGHAVSPGWNRLQQRSQGSFNDIPDAGGQLFGPVAAFLMSRVGYRWTRVLREVLDRAGSADAACRVAGELEALVAIRVSNEAGMLRFTDGLMAGQSLRAGWRRKLYVCPRTGRLRRIPA